MQSWCSTYAQVAGARARFMADSGIKKYLKARIYYAKESAAIYL